MIASVRYGNGYGNNGNGRSSGSTKYRYDKKGNISAVYENGKLSVRYTYDGWTV